jgi:hypothetical protein
MYLVLLWMHFLIHATRYAAEISSRNGPDLSKFCPCL